MPPKRPLPQQIVADLPPEKAHNFLSAQLEKLQAIKMQNYQDGEAVEQEWYQLTEKLVMRSFGSESPNHKNFRNGRSAGESSFVVSDIFGRETGIDHGLHQRNFQARLQAYEGALKSSLAELEIDLPDVGIKGVYQPGEEYEFYRDVSTCLKLALKEIFVIDPYLNIDIFNVYADAIPRTVRFRLLSANVPADVKTVAQKYAAGGNLEFRSSNSIHDPGAVFR